ncbi:MAG: GNAT family N-acetyltransferase [Roseiflexaceae bacterium]|jgi:RimJ/RimL family protein N-acetyltransferase|nr:GNAT family N-acetyltransferase [Chloroflexaceae bacterium]
MPQSTWITRTQFSGHVVRLEALNADQHRDGLIAAGADSRIWTYVRFPPADTPAGMNAHIAELIRRRNAGDEVPYVVIQQSSNTIVGVTRFIELRPAHKGLELGTWLNPQVHGDGTNIEIKYLMLQYAFEVLGCIRVQIKTNANNSAAQRSLVALGATYEGLFRNHYILHDGSVRDSLFYSIIDREWPTIKAHIQQRLARRTAT